MAGDVLPVRVKVERQCDHCRGIKPGWVRDPEYPGFGLMPCPVCHTTGYVATSMSLEEFAAIIAKVPIAIR